MPLIDTGSAPDGSGRRAGHPLVWLVPAAVALRLLLFLGRGSFVAFDEGWYLLLGQHLWAGEGYTLTGLRHTTLSPLFPVLAGAAALLLENPVWAGRAVAAITAGLLPIPCWSIFRRLAGRRTALLGCAIIAVLPSLAPFTVPYWVGWDLWMGPEPVYHLFLYTGVAFALRGVEGGRVSDCGWAGAAFALAYLARPEAIVIGGLLGLLILVASVRRGSLRPLARPAAFALAFGLVATPYWLYLHDALGRWTVTGRHVEAPTITHGIGARGAGGEGASATIERMIWQGEQDDYVQTLFALHPSGVRLASPYWGVPAEDGSAAPVSSGSPGAEVQPSRRAGDSTAPPPADDAPGAQEKGAAKEDQPPNRAIMYARALGVGVPGFVWPFIIVGILAPRRRDWKLERLAATPLAIASPLIAGWVAVDPRTQLFLVPWLALYAARGIRILGQASDRRVRGNPVRRGLVFATLAFAVIGLLLAGDAHRLYSSIRKGSPHHVLGTENRLVGQALRDIVPASESVMSWDPAVALYAQRDWRVLPYGSMAEVIRYAAAIHCEYIVLSRVYPSPPIVQQVPATHLVLHLPPSETAWSRWAVEWIGRGENFVFGQVKLD